eukprot:CAMPEP_0185902618 /NCGR_PEP_ID=MMETSP0196C-20130402/1823_1 /TAXON_ID=2932 /ORGANISM="Alexandrium fundyense, Strain CCMP1719" /LENGTH=41 /DNA_ID= /DNA_START= /DNA_END= /DNA_ORIENTATION=
MGKSEKTRKVEEESPEEGDTSAVASKKARTILKGSGQSNTH